MRVAPATASAPATAGAAPAAGSCCAAAADRASTRCALASPPAYKAASGYGPLTVQGYGRVNGQTMMRRFLFKVCMLPMCLCRP